MKPKEIPITFGDIAKALGGVGKHTAERDGDTYKHAWTFDCPSPTFEAYGTFTSEEDLKNELIRQMYYKGQTDPSTTP